MCSLTIDSRSFASPVIKLIGRRFFNLEGSLLPLGRITMIASFQASGKTACLKIGLINLVRRLTASLGSNRRARLGIPSFPGAFLEGRDRRR